ncbi:Clp protease N-terminal domain-containing protein [Dictyobacter kobayashii]|uniref:Clp R domain-containing protein n=1 Tax=Dictyobacter kobayashii TaxID=2014872 RepID=A0A402ARJ3_9CHLR|nr:Clp protease N-terminal domain-containing protein [Dictyobacter kobayashii]GCE21721.1 hypothetical protein KDK_55210 [Dictyobacter kobayashii]
MATLNLSFSISGLLGRIVTGLGSRRGGGRKAPVHERDRFKKFTNRARAVLSLSQEEASRLKHSAIGPEHFLLGLLREGNGIAGQTLASLGVELQQARQLVEEHMGRGTASAYGEIGLTPGAKHVIELAIDEAQQLNHHFLGTEHLLLGLLRQGEVTEILERLGLNIEQVRTQTLAKMHIRDTKSDPEHP